MKHYQETYEYTIFGLSVLSSIKLPELISNRLKIIDVSIILGHVPEHLPKITNSGVLFESSLDDFLFHVKNVCSYRVQKGKLVTIQPSPGSNPQEVRIFLLGTVMGALLHQRGSIPIHGSAISINGNAVIFAGKSASGKSTLAASLAVRGIKILADDISAIGIGSDDSFLVYPGITNLRLWKDVIDHLRIRNSTKKIRSSLEKYSWKIIQPPINEPSILKSIIIISQKNTDGFTKEEITGTSKFHYLKTNTYRYQFLDQHKQTMNHFSLISRICHSIPVIHVQRPTSPLLIGEFTDFIENEVLFSS